MLVLEREDGTVCELYDMMFWYEDFYTYLVKEKVLLNAARSNKKYKFKKKPEGKKPSYVWPHLSKMKFDVQMCHFKETVAF